MCIEMHEQNKGVRFMNKEKCMPVIFTGHGSPMNAIGNNRARNGWKSTGLMLGKPSVIIAVSAHWTTNGLSVRRSDINPQINDMYGFPEELYRVHYEPAGSVEYADKIIGLLGEQITVRNGWGIDHGIWSVLSNMYPDADVPVVMISTDMSADAAAHFEIGKQLSPLRNEGALIVASGNVVHNLGMVGWDMQGGYDWADRFDAAIRDAITSGSFEIPVNYKSLSDAEGSLSDAEKAVPTAEHYYPLLVALGAASKNDNVTVWNEYRELGSMSMTSYLFSPRG